MKTTIASLCEDSSMLNSYIIDVKRSYNYSLNGIISLGNILCFNLVTRILYIWKVIIAKTAMSRLSRDGFTLLYQDILNIFNGDPKKYRTIEETNSLISKYISNIYIDDPH